MHGVGAETVDPHPPTADRSRCEEVRRCGRIGLDHISINCCVAAADAPSALVALDVGPERPHHPSRHIQIGLRYGAVGKTDREPVWSPGHHQRGDELARHGAGHLDSRTPDRTGDLQWKAAGLAEFCHVDPEAPQRVDQITDRTGTKLSMAVDHHRAATECSHRGCEPSGSSGLTGIDGHGRTAQLTAASMDCRRSPTGIEIDANAERPEHAQHCLGVVSDQESLESGVARRQRRGDERPVGDALGARNLDGAIGWGHQRLDGKRVSHG